jgi:hypothetical protein
MFMRAIALCLLTKDQDLTGTAIATDTNGSRPSSELIAVK